MVDLKKLGRRLWQWLLRPQEDQAKSPYGLTFNRLRIVTGLCGLLLPVLLLVVDHALVEDPPYFRLSLSAYYHSGAARDIFVGVLCLTGACLLAYRISPSSFEKRVAITAGAAAVVVAWFPTTRDATQPQQTQTPLQRVVGEDLVAQVHAVGAFVFIGCLSLTSVFFWYRETHQAA